MPKKEKKTFAKLIFKTERMIAVLLITSNFINMPNSVVIVLHKHNCRNNFHESG